jgi:hypothetical protein
MPFMVFTMFHGSAKALKSLQNAGERLPVQAFTGGIERSPAPAAGRTLPLRA